MIKIKRKEEREVERSQPSPPCGRFACAAPASPSRFAASSGNALLRALLNAGACPQNLEHFLKIKEPVSIGDVLH
jgi:hypothetical protein